MREETHHGQSLHRAEPSATAKTTLLSYSTQGTVFVTKMRGKSTKIRIKVVGIKF